MPLRHVSGRDLTYHFIAFDESGRERCENGACYSEQVLATAMTAQPPVTDVFVISHGWMGDVPAAIRQYDRWLSAMYDQRQDRAAAHLRRPDWQPLTIALHWPSLPWGDERLHRRPALLSAHDGGRADEFAAENAIEVDTLIDTYARRIADTSRARAALRTILETRPHQGRILTQRVEDAYVALFTESALTCGGTSTAPGADQEDFNPATIIAQAQQQAGGRSMPAVLGGNAADPGLDLVRMPLRQLSFWKMKDRARRFGESGAHNLLRDLQHAAHGARFHLMGHSFGCIVTSGAVVGRPGTPERPQPVHTLFLAQGALSLWAFADERSNPHRRGTPGYYHRLLADRLVRGPVATTRSAFDTAVGRFYPLGARLARQRHLGKDLPAYGGIGTFGIQGVPDTADAVMVNNRQRYDFRPGRVHNLEATNIIRHGSGPSGAHSDIAQPAVAHAFWQAAIAV
ncbi:hypothetical protein [Modestobacter marinus]|uniref:hypothetical protein n=1 Tax=Modestobacter marinus TaxID=477641 RepID=UPI001C941007|nr:hypothetical protein [Modestobacter marinus]